MLLDDTMTNDTRPENFEPFISGKQLMGELFVDGSRPTIRWLRRQTKLRTIPHIKVGRLVFFRRSDVMKSVELLQLDQELKSL